MSSPLIALVGRTNVGKSALFNRIVKPAKDRAKALVSKIAGVTRDLNIETVNWQGYNFRLGDTAGFDPTSADDLSLAIYQHTLSSMQNAAAALLVVDCQSGLMSLDEDIFSKLKKNGKPFFLVVNKVDDPIHEQLTAEFYKLGEQQIYLTSALHNRGIDNLLSAVVSKLTLPPSPAPSLDNNHQPSLPKLLLLGRPNAGKSTLANNWIGEEQLLVSDQPGTTVDAISIPIYFEQQRLLLVDAAGVRRKSKVVKELETMSVKAVMHNLTLSDICVILIDATSGFSDQDAKLAKLAFEKHCSLIIAINKWDLISQSDPKSYRQAIYYRRPYLQHVDLVFISAAKKQGTKKLLKQVLNTLKERNKKVSSAQFNQFLQYLSASSAGRKLKINYGTQVGVSPPAFSLYVNSPQLVTPSIEKHLIKQLRRFFGFQGTPVRLFWRSKHGPSA